MHLEGSADLSAQVYRQLRTAILDGRLRPGERLPPTRELARSAAVSRNTVATAYDRLLAEGFVTARVGSGTFVADLTGGTRPPNRAPGGTLRPRRIWQELPPPGPSGPAPEFDLRAGTPDPALFPLPVWRRLVTRELRTGTIAAASRAGPAGDPRLRAAVARWLGVSRSVAAGTDDVLITNGAQQALDLIARVLLEPGDVVAVEEPGYPMAHRLFRSHGARPAGVPVDAQGLIVDALPPAARLVYTTPSHQFPTGVTMSPARRRELLAWAGRHGAAIVEDDYDSEFRFGNRPLEPLQSLDADGRVLYVGSFCKTMLPSLRLGFLVAPAALLPALTLARQVGVQHGDACTEAAVAAFLDEGLFARHLRTTTRVYAERRALLLDALHGPLSRWLVPVESVAGLHLSAHLRPEAGADAAAVVERAARAGVAVQTLAHFCLAPPERDGLVIGYSSIPAGRLPEALRRLAGCFAEA
ncbi:transcriptional regulator, GntR family [Actinoplanes derwentensis]|uniref:Transcriptional regulator, GntR family n=1 Tax=Actinoplanes derwentensis TaxID=113562 RepID=A0A1H1SB27_9ACTN|nr:transcriptional regulator, GntR family [Actinoplanes derwentensis]